MSLKTALGAVLLAHGRGLPCVPQGIYYRQHHIHNLAMVAHLCSQDSGTVFRFRPLGCLNPSQSLRIKIGCTPAYSVRKTRVLEEHIDNDSSFSYGQ